MNIKLVGVGKCGSRICYDFFAQIRGLPTSYEIKTKGQDSAFAEIWRRIRAKTGIERSTMEIRRQWESLTGAELLKDSAYYAMVDSDLDNNEVARQVELLSKSGETAIFPGYSHKLADQNGGCQFHIISENLTRNWQTSQVPQDVLSPVSAEVFAFAFSVGGGTGGGSGIQLAGKSKELRKYNTRNNREICYMGLGVLPYSDECYTKEEEEAVKIDSKNRPAMDGNEKYNTGRFFTGFVGRRNWESGEPYFNGLWLVSNDLLRFLTEETAHSVSIAGSKKERILSSKGLALVNAYLAQALCTLCNSSSRGTHSDADGDARELNGSLSGDFFISAFSHLKYDAGQNSDLDAAHLQRLFRNALCNTTITNEQLHGLSVPVKESSIELLRLALETSAYSFDALHSLLVSYNAKKGPWEFYTARRVIMFYGQPEKSPSTHRQLEARKILRFIFPNSERTWYDYRHPGENEYLLIFIVNPILPVVVNSMMDYVAKTWLKDGSFLMSPLIRNQVFDKGGLVNALEMQDELDHLPNDLLGASTVHALKTLAPIWPFRQEVVVSALERIHAAEHWMYRESERY